MPPANSLPGSLPSSHAEPLAVPKCSHHSTPCASTSAALRQDCVSTPLPKLSLRQDPEQKPLRITKRQDTCPQQTTCRPNNHGKGDIQHKSEFLTPQSNKLNHRSFPLCLVLEYFSCFKKAF